LAESLLSAAAAITLLSIVVSFVRFVLGPDTLSRVVAFDGMTIMSLSILVFVSWYLHRTIYLDVALVYGLLSFLGVIALARFGEGEL